MTTQQTIDIDSDNLTLRENANVSHESAEDWYGSYGAHISTDDHGDITVQAVDYDWLDDDNTTDTYRDEALDKLDKLSEGDFGHCDDKPNDLADALARGDEDDLQAWIDYLRADDYPDSALEAMGNELADEIEAALEQVKEINRWAEKADTYAAAKLREDKPALDWDSIESLVALAKRVREAAEGVVSELEAAVESYEEGDLDGVIEHLQSARSQETDHGDDPATSTLAGQLLAIGVG